MSLIKKIHTAVWYARYGLAKILFGDFLRWYKSEGFEEGAQWALEEKQTEH